MTRSARASAARLLLSCALACCFSPAPVPAQQRAASRPAARSVLFSVVRYDADNTQIEPVAILSRGSYLAPPVDGDTADGADKITAERFISAYFRRGRGYRLFFGGAPAGEVSVVRYLEPGCVSMIAQARAETEAPLGGERMALATDSPALVARQSNAAGTTRRAPAPAERSAALRLARSEFSRRGVTGADLRDLKVHNLTALDLDADGRAELVGSFYAGAYESAIEEGRSAYLTMLVFFEPTAGEDFRIGYMVADGRPNVAEIAGRVLVDALDLDGDGVAEVVTQNRYYESHTYTIYKRAKRTADRGWRPVYTGGGGGC